jgi:hypothetical protein
MRRRFDGATFLSLIGVASELWVVFVLLMIGGLGSAALHPVGTTIAGSQASNATVGVGLFTVGGMVGFAKTRTHPTHQPSDGRFRRSPSRAASARSWGASLAPRLGPVLTIVGAFLLSLCPLVAVIASEPGTALYFGAIALAGILMFVPVPALVIIAHEFVPGAPATASGMVLGLGSV